MKRWSWASLVMGDPLLELVLESAMEEALLGFFFFWVVVYGINGSGYGACDLWGLVSGQRPESRDLQVGFVCFILVRKIQWQKWYI